MNAKDRIRCETEGFFSQLCEISKAMYECPEQGMQEKRSARMLEDWLETRGFSVEREFHGVETAFRAVYGAGRPVIGFLCEYDALPDIGHGCGHNLIGIMSAGAAAAFASVLDGSGTVVVYGTPDEECTCTKVGFAQDGVFDELDAALMLHPYKYTCVRIGSAGVYPLQLEFFGQKCHASEAGPRCVNALDAAVMSYAAIAQLAQYLDANIHGIVKEGGVLPSIIPDYACLQYYIRCDAQWKTNLAVQRVIRCAQGVADSMGAGLKTSQFLTANQTLLPNGPLLNLLEENLLQLGQQVESRTSDRISTDAGDVSWRVPTLHGMIGLPGCEQLELHTRAFADATVSAAGQSAARTGILALAGTAWDLWHSPQQMEQVRSAFGAALKQEKRKEESNGLQTSGR